MRWECLAQWIFSVARIGASDQPCVGRRAHEHDTHKQNTCSDARAAPFVPQACITARKTGKTGWRIIRRILKAGERKTLPIFGKYDYKLLFLQLVIPKQVILKRCRWNSSTGNKNRADTSLLQLDSNAYSLQACPGPFSFLSWWWMTTHWIGLLFLLLYSSLLRQYCRTFG